MRQGAQRNLKHAAVTLLLEDALLQDAILHLDVAVRTKETAEDELNLVSRLVGAELASKGVAVGEVEGAKHRVLAVDDLGAGVESSSDVASSKHGQFCDDFI